MKVLKFGGKSLSFSTQIKKVIEIIKNEPDPKVVVVSAIGTTTDDLVQLIERAKNGQPYLNLLEQFIGQDQHSIVDLKEEFAFLKRSLEGIELLGDYSLKVKDQILALGELISARVVTELLNAHNHKAHFVDSRQLIITDDQFGNAQPNEELSIHKTTAYFTHLPLGTTPVVTGFIASTIDGATTTLGRNGSNYTASLLAKYLQAEEMQNYTHVDGIFTANPEWVTDAQPIAQLHYKEANELAHYGANIIHAKTILPLIEKNIPLRILNTQNPEGKGTLISSTPTAKGIKSLTVQNDVALLNLEGKGLLGKTGIDARIFKTLAAQNINVGLISQGSSERGIGFVIADKDAELAIKLLRHEFETDLKSKDVEHIQVNREIAVLTIIGQDLSTFDKPYSALIQNGITPILFNNTVEGNHVSIVLPKADAKRAINVVHGQIFGIAKRINLAIFGHGTVGGVLIDQILEQTTLLEEKKNIRLNIFAIGNSKELLLYKNGIGASWRNDLITSTTKSSAETVISYANEHHLENLILIDNTASLDFTNEYIHFVSNGFDLISSNKIANTVDYTFYETLRLALKKHKKHYLYETNVGAGLPLIDTIKLLHLSGENITRIRGVFSGTLSYIFNRFSIENQPFSAILQDAIHNGFTEPDPRDDLSGTDVARKLLILARELELRNELNSIEVENLIPAPYDQLELTNFLSDLTVLDAHFDHLKKALSEGQVLRYIGDLSGDLQQDEGTLKTGLVAVDQNSPLGQLKGSDSIFEIYTESYGSNPIIIQGAGAGAKVTARGVFGDILRLALKAEH